MLISVECNECGRSLSPQEVLEIAEYAGVPLEMVPEVVLEAFCTRCGGGLMAVKFDDTRGFEVESEMWPL